MRMLQVIEVSAFFPSIGEKRSSPFLPIPLENTIQDAVRGTRRERRLDVDTGVDENAQTPRHRPMLCLHLSKWKMHKQGKSDRNGHYVMHVRIAERQTAEVNEARERTNANHLVCVCVCVQFFSFFFFLWENVDSVTNVKAKLNKISVSCRLLSIEHWSTSMSTSELIGFRFF